MKVLELDHIFPIQAIEKDLLMAGNGDITSGWNLMLPEVFSMDSDYYILVYKGFVNAIKRLAPGSVVLKQDYYFKRKYDGEIDTKSLIKKENNRSYLGRPMLHHFFLGRCKPYPRKSRNTH